MEHVSTKLAAAIVGCTFILALQTAFAAKEDLGNGFLHHGVATPTSNDRGIVATVDGEGRDVVLVWLYDCRGTYELVMVDAETGKSDEFPMPFPPGGDGVYASVLSSTNKLYTHFNSNFCEFDPVKRAFTFFQQSAPQMAMSMTEDDSGVIWSATYPQSGVVSFNPATREFKDYGHLYKQDWAQYPRSVAADDKGWIYLGIGFTSSQIVMLDPKTGAGTPIIPEAERVQGGATVSRDVNGKVYGQSGTTWYELYNGVATKLAEPPKVTAKPIITGSQGLRHTNFPDGKILKTCDTVEHVMTIEDPKTSEVKTVNFTYASEGAHVMGLAVAPDNTICGGTAFPMRFFIYNPEKDEWINHAAYCQCNTVARQGDRFFVGGYGGGYITEWNPAAPWVDTVKGQADCNPLFLTDCAPTINRPHDLLAHPDGKTLVLAGTPGYGYTGGGLLFWDRETKTQTLLQHTDILPELSTSSLAALPEGKLLGGTTTSPGTGGERKAQQAELYIIDMATKKLDWHAAVFPGVQEYTDLCIAPNGLVYGFADCKRFFVFDPAKREVVREEDASATFGSTSYQQGPRVFVLSPEGVLYILFVKGVARVDQSTHAITMLAESPVPVHVGGDILNGRIYFASGSHVYSYQVPK